MAHEQNNPSFFTTTRGALAFLAVGVVALVFAFVVGISDNPPGLSLMYAGCSSLVLAVVHQWRSPMRFLCLLGGSVAAFIGGAFLHNLFWALGHVAFPNLPVGILWLLEAAHVVFFLVAVVLAPPGFLIGLIGCLITGIRQWRERRQAS